MSEWASNTLKQVEARREDERLRRETFLEKQRVKKAEGPLLWKAVCEEILNNCRGFNTQIGEEALRIVPEKDGRLVVRSRVDGAARELRVRFDEAAGSLSWGCEGEGGEFSIEVPLDGRARFADKFGGADPDSVAAQMLNTLVLARRAY